MLIGDMGKVLITQNRKVTMVLLKEINVFGRHPSSDFLFQKDKRLPNYWLEVRWFNEQWHWRALNKEDFTIGTGRSLKSKWKLFSKTIRLKDVVVLELITDDPPTALIENVQSKERYYPKDFDSISQEQGLLFFQNKSLHNGSFFREKNNLYQVWIPNNDESITIEEFIDILSESCTLDIELSTLKAIFTDGESTLSINGEGARILAVYANEVLAEEPWLFTFEAFESWRALGGQEKSTAERMSWERSKIVRQLMSLQVKNAQHLFIRKKKGYGWMHALNFPRHRITFL